MLAYFDVIFLSQSFLGLLCPRRISEYIEEELNSKLSMFCALSQSYKHFVDK